MANSILIANSLNISESLILEVQEWAFVLWVRIRGLRPRFISKKALVMAAVSIAVGRASAVPNAITVNASRVTNGWVAELERGNEFGTILRNFIHGDRSGCSRAGNGDIIYADPADGYYEAESTVRSAESGKEWFLIDGGTVTHFDCQDAMAADMWGCTVEQIRAAREARIAAIREVELAAAKQKESELGELPALTGSEKQIAWATKIRAEKLDLLNKWHKIYEEDCAEENADDRDRKNLELFSKALEVFRPKASASFWIDHRSMDFGDQSEVAWMLDRNK